MAESSNKNENSKDWITKMQEERREKAEKDFLKKKSAEKFKFLYDQQDELEDKIFDLESKVNYCDDSFCEINEEWIEKIKIEQQDFLYRIECLESVIEELTKRVKKLEKLKK